MTMIKRGKSKNSTIEVRAEGKENSVCCVKCGKCFNSKSQVSCDKKDCPLK